MVDGDEDVKTAVATCLLENLVNAAAAGKVDPASLVDLLGSESLAYCQAWHRFAELATPGLSGE